MWIDPNDRGGRSVNYVIAIIIYLHDEDPSKCGLLSRVCHSDTYPTSEELEESKLILYCSSYGLDIEEHGAALREMISNNTFRTLSMVEAVEEIDPFYEPEMVVENVAISEADVIKLPDESLLEMLNRAVAAKSNPGLDGVLAGQNDDILQQEMLKRMGMREQPQKIQRSEQPTLMAGLD